MAAIEGGRSDARRPSTVRLLGKQVGYQLKLLARSPMAAFATLVIPLMVLLAVNLLYSGTRLSSRGGIPFAQFFTPAMVAFAVVNACYMSVISSTTLARDEGILKRIRGTPLPPWVYMTGRLVSSGLVASVGTRGGARGRCLRVRLLGGLGRSSGRAADARGGDVLFLLAGACRDGARADRRLGGPDRLGDDAAAVLHLRRLPADRQRPSLVALDRVVVSASSARRRPRVGIQSDHREQRDPSGPSGADGPVGIGVGRLRAARFPLGTGRERSRRSWIATAGCVRSGPRPRIARAACPTRAPPSAERSASSQRAA